MAAATTNTDAATRRLLAAINERKPADEIKRMLDRMGQGSEERRKAVLNPKLETPLQAAHRLASHSVAAALLVAGASPSQLFNGEATALAICCAKGNADGVRALLVAGHDPAEKTTNFCRRSSEGYNGGLTAAHVCAVWSTGGKQVGQMECLRVLVEEGGADINAKNDGDETPIFWRMFVTSPKDPRASVDAFVSLGADLEARRRDGRTPLFVAAETNHLKVVEAMLDAGASPDARAKDGSTVLMDAIRFNKTRDRKAIIEELLRRSSPDTRRAVDGNGDSAVDFMVAANRVSNGGDGGGDAAYKPFEAWQLQVIVELRESGAPVKRSNAAAIKVEDDQQQEQGEAAAGGSRVRAREEAQGRDAGAANGRDVKRPAVATGGERQDDGDGDDDDVVVAADEGAEDQQEREKRERRRELAERLKELEEEFLARAREIKTEMHEL